MGSSAPSDPGLQRRRRLLYGRRKGPKLSPRQEELRRTLLPQLALRLEQGRDPRTYFSSWPGSEAKAERDPATQQITDVWLEVGFGGGEHLIEQARANPRVGLIGAEPYEAGVAKLLSKIEQEFSSPVLSAEALAKTGYGGGAAEGGGGGINIRIHEGDARDIIAALPDASIGRVFILFPDPWPKTRHHKRRFVQMETLDALARVMKPNAELRFASDDAGYLDWTLERLMAHPDFAWTAERAADWKMRPPDWPQTRYEAKALHGSPAYLIFVRRGKMM